MKIPFKWLACGVGLLTLYALGLGMRRAVLDAQYAVTGADLPFTLESALYFRRISQVFNTGRLPAHDAMIQHPEGIDVWRTDTVGAEYVYAALAHLFPRAMPLPDRVRWIEPAWFCLGIPLLALWLGWWTRSALAAGIGGAYYAVSLSSVIRSTGQELSHENAALPLLIGHLALDAAAEGAAGARRFWLFTAGSSLLLASALAWWDLVQFYVGLWMIASWVALARGRLRWDARTGGKWAAQLAALCLVGAWNPYLRAHGWLLSPEMLLGYGLAAALWVSRRATVDGAPRMGRWWAAGLALVPLALGLAIAWRASYGQAYSPFLELLCAKLRFLNVKPANPALLTFNQRILWTPALHSATWNIVISQFPAILPLTLLALAVCYISSIEVGARFNRLVFFYIASLVAFILLVRFHVFLAIFSAALLGWWAAWSLRRQWWVRLVVLALLVLGTAVEAAHVLKKPWRWGRPNVYYAEARDLTRWLLDHAAPDPVLANFGISASVAAYGGCPVVLHPKFEAPDIRARVRDYAEALFQGTETQFREWAGRHGARYYVYALGEFSTVAPDQQLRYMVNCLDPRPDAAARGFEDRPGELREFAYLWGNRKYRVFKILTPEDLAEAVVLAGAAEEELQRGDLVRAGRLAAEAARLDPRQTRASRVLEHVRALQAQGFHAGGAAE